MDEIYSPETNSPAPYEQSFQGLHSRPTNHFVEFKKGDIEHSITDRFEQQVLRYPERLAVNDGSQQLNYDSLNKAANRLARTILAECGTGEEPIGLLFEHGAPGIVAILGVLKAGKICVPLDPVYPHKRNSYMLEDSHASILLTNDRNLSSAKGLSPVVRKVINVDEIGSSVSTENLNIPISPDTIAYILYTSGSSGYPKGVVQNHRNVLHTVMKYTNGIHICADDHLSLLPSLSFAASVPDMHGALLNGASLFPLNLKDEGLVKLAKWLIMEEITIYHSVPTVFRHFAKTLTGEGNFPKLRLVKLCGEAVYKNDVNLFMRYFSKKCRLLIGYGATEMNIIREYYFDEQAKLDENIVPVGYGVEDTDVLLIDDDGREVVGFNRAGEIVVKSPFLALGYWRDEELTSSKFQSGPTDSDEKKYFTGDLGCMMPDGCLRLLGRKDLQVKIRGNRVEPAEVEMALLGIDGIKETAVFTRKDKQGDQILIAGIVTDRRTLPTIDKLRAFLLEKLPDHMVPSVFVLVDALPLTPNGKVDRSALPAPDLSKRAFEKVFIPPRTPLEIQIAEVWREVLGVDHVGINDSFFDLGGHSLRLMEVADKLENLISVRIHPAVMISKTLGELASACQKIIKPPQRSDQMTFRKRLQDATRRVVSRIGRKNRNEIPSQ